MRTTTRFLTVVLGALLIPLAAQAARPARVDLDVVEVRDGPGENYKILFSLTKGTGLASANVAIEGYYKVRALDGRVGWVPADSLLFVNASPGEAAVQSFANDASTEVMGAPNSPPDTKAEKAPAKLEDPSVRRKWFGFRLLGGYSFFNPAEVNALFSTTILLFGYSPGIELGVLFSERFSFWVRAEWMYQYALAVPASGTNSFQWEIMSFPVMGGFEFKIWSNPLFRFDVGLLGGAGLFTRFTSTALQSATPNVTSYADTAWGGLAKLGFHWTPAHWFGLGLQAGYRYLRTFPTGLAVEGNGGNFLQVNGQYPRIALDLSGPFAELVLGIQL